MNPPRLLEGDELDFAVAGVLLLYRGVRPGYRVPVRDTLERLGFLATSWDIHHSVERWRIRGLVIDASERQVGYRAVDVAGAALARPFRRRRSENAAAQAVLIECDSVAESHAQARIRF